MFELLTGKGQKYLCLMGTGASGKILSSQITNELNLVAYPLGVSITWTASKMAFARVILAMLASWNVSNQL